MVLAGAIAPSVVRFIVMLSAQADAFGVAPRSSAESRVDNGKAVPLVGRPPRSNGRTNDRFWREATGAVMEVTKWLKPSISVSRIGDSASVQAATRVNAEQALYGAFEVKHIFYTILYFLSFQFLCSTRNPVSSPRPTPLVEADAHRACQGRPSLCPGRTLRRFQAAP